MKQAFSVTGQLVDINAKSIYPARITVEGERIVSIEKISAQDADPGYILPGFTDAHVHVESSMLVPSEFARLAVVHGTVATISDPHEIANVCGMEGIRFMIENGRSVPFKFNFGAPSCVPATPFETAGAEITVQDIETLMQQDEILYLSEMMNFPGVLQGDADVLAKIATAHRYQKPVDGHAPGLIGEAARQYIDAGISTDHECFTAAEALDKLQYGMRILIREGSAARNFEALADLISEHADWMMFCSDDKHPDSLVEGHINQLCARAVAKGIDVFKVLQVACVNPVNHYKMRVGLLRENDFADFIRVDDLRSFTVRQTFINGVIVAEDGKSLIDPPAAKGVVNKFNCGLKQASDFAIPAGGHEVPAIEALDGQLITNKRMVQPRVVNGYFTTDTETDLLKIAVVNRYAEAPVATAFIRNIGLQRGAIASSVAHDSHNIVVVGVDDESMCRAVNAIINQKGGVSCVDEGDETILPLPVGGLMSADNGYAVAEAYAAIDRKAKAMGSKLGAPYMTLSFMALLVIPHIKLSDKGLFDGDRFVFFNAV